MNNLFLIKNIYLIKKLKKCNFFILLIKMYNFNIYNSYYRIFLLMQGTFPKSFRLNDQKISENIHF